MPYPRTTVQSDRPTELGSAGRGCGMQWVEDPHGRGTGGVERIAQRVYAAFLNIGNSAARWRVVCYRVCRV
jgi:hypothetical protein